MLRGDGSPPSQMERDFEHGALGEERFGNEVNRFAARSGGFGALHGLVPPGGHGDIDHIVVGPAGVTVIDAKLWTGKASIRRGTLRIGGRSKGACIEGVKSQVERVRRALSEAGHGTVPVEAALCLVDGNLGGPAAPLERVDSVAVGAPPAVIARASRSGPLGLDDLRSVQATLAAHYRVMGGAIEPSAPLPPARRPRPAFRLSARLVEATAALALFAAAPFVASTVLSAAGTAFTPLSRSELTANRAEYRALASKRAGGKVRGPRVLTAAGEFRLAFSRGKRCRVVITVTRTARLLHRPAPLGRSVGCQRR
jgi:hypothetical protein